MDTNNKYRVSFSVTEETHRYLCAYGDKSASHGARSIILNHLYHEGGADKLERTTKVKEASKRIEVQELEKIVKNHNKSVAPDVISYLNKKAGTKFLCKGANEKMIYALIKQGYEYEDFLEVVDKKCDEWKGSTQWAKFLRPKTLFAPSNFASYLGSKTDNDRDKEFFALWEQPDGV